MQAVMVEEWTAHAQGDEVDGVALRENFIGLAIMLVSLDWLHAERGSNHSWAPIILA